MGGFRYNGWAEYWRGYKRKPLVNHYPCHAVKALVRHIFEDGRTSPITLSGRNMLVKGVISKEWLKIQPPEGEDYYIWLESLSGVNNSKRYVATCRCGKKCIKLYASDGYLLCRKCLGLKYYSQRIAPNSRPCFTLIRLEKKLNTKHGKWDGSNRPFYMHKKTYRTLQENIWKFEEDLFHKLPEDLFWNPLKT